MKRILLFGSLVLVVCSPLFFVAFLLTAASVPALDRMTAAMPMTIRSAVAELALNTHGGASNMKTRERVLRLDPTNFDANNPGCRENRPAGSSSHCTLVLGDASRAAKLNLLGLEQERAGDPCTAEDTFTRANESALSGKAHTCETWVKPPMSADASPTASRS